MMTRDLRAAVHFRRVLASLAACPLLLFAATAFPIAVRAAGIEILLNGTADHPALILVKGQLVKDDDVKFSTLADAQKTPAVVFLESRGGLVLAGLQIGRAIRRHGFATAVADNAVCASACAIAWMGGKQRFMGFYARIGFHAAMAPTPDKMVASSLANGAIGSYYYEMGVTDPTVIAVLTTTPPQEMRWLSINDGQMRIGHYTIFSFAEPRWAWARDSLVARNTTVAYPTKNLEAYALHRRKFSGAD
jgi:hypothetical protein